jgi:hypothetical protein
MATFTVPAALLSAVLCCLSTMSTAFACMSPPPQDSRDRLIAHATAFWCLPINLDAAVVIDQAYLDERLGTGASTGAPLPVGSHSGYQNSKGGYDLPSVIPATDSCGFWEGRVRSTASPDRAIFMREPYCCLEERDAGGAWSVRHCAKIEGLTDYRNITRGAYQPYVEPIEITQIYVPYFRKVIGNDLLRTAEEPTLEFDWPDKAE